MSEHNASFKQRIRSILASRKRQSIGESDLVCAAVLIPLLYKHGEWHILVTQRSETVAHHKGQISFPGGACEPHDADLLATALRETNEEIGVPPAAVDVLGALDDFPTITQFSVTPYVGVIPHPFAYQIDTAEVATVVEVPLAFFQDPANLRIEKIEHEGRIHDVLFWDFGPYIIWGATARTIKSFLDLL